MTFLPELCKLDFFVQQSQIKAPEPNQAASTSLVTVSSSPGSIVSFVILIALGASLDLVVAILFLLIKSLFAALSIHSNLHSFIVGQSLILYFHL